MKNYQNPKQRIKSRICGFSLVEVLVAAVIMGVAIAAIYSAILWGRYRATQTQYVVSASDVGRHQIEVIKSMGFTNAADPGSVKYDVSSTFFNNNLSYGGIFSRTNQFSIDSNYDMESSYTDDSSIPSNVMRVFTVKVYLHPSNAADTDQPPFNQVLVSYVTYIVPKGI